MPESTLALRYDDIAGEVGFLLGFGRGIAKGESKWGASQQNAIDSAIQSGLRRFYHSAGYKWSFLKPTAELTLVSGESTVALPDDFGSLDGQVSFTNAGQGGYTPLSVIGEGEVRNLHAFYSATTGPPQKLAVRPIKGVQAKKGQRFEFYVFPVADGNYTLGLAYDILPECLTGVSPYAYGGVIHIETILEGCLAVAEERIDDAQGVHRMAYDRLLAGSIVHDQSLKPQLLGYNGDRSAWGNYRDRRDQMSGRISVNGAIPT